MLIITFYSRVACGMVRVGLFVCVITENVVQGFIVKLRLSL